MEHSFILRPLLIGKYIYIYTQIEMKTKCELFNHKRHPVYDCSSQLGVQIAQCECQIIHFKMCQSFGSTCIQWFNWEIEIVCCVPNERILKIHTVTLFPSCLRMHVFIFVQIHHRMSTRNHILWARSRFALAMLHFLELYYNLYNKFIIVYHIDTYTQTRAYQIIIV